MFIGEYIYSIDEKKRVSIPSKFRKELGKRAVITRGIDNCLVLYPEKEWEKLAKKLESLPSSRRDARHFIRLMLSGAVNVTFDKLGRILIPDYLREYAKIGKNVAVLGLSNRIEIWDAKEWNNQKKKSENMVEEMAEKLDELGI